MKKTFQKNYTFLTFCMIFDVFHNTFSENYTFFTHFRAFRADFQNIIPQDEAEHRLTREINGVGFVIPEAREADRRTAPAAFRVDRMLRFRIPRIVVFSEFSEALKKRGMS